MFCGIYHKEFKKILQHNPPAPEYSPISPYNPPKYGRAYYFMKETGQIICARKFTIDEQGTKRNRDDASTTSKLLRCCIERYMLHVSMVLS